VNDDLHGDLENLQILQCIICRLEKISCNVLSQSFNLMKNLFKQNKINGITLVNIHIDIVHPRLFIKKKAQLT
jgi:hypothetical protein